MNNTTMNPGPALSIGKDRAGLVHRFAASNAGVFAPLPAAVAMGIINAEPQSAVTTLIALSFPMTLVIGFLFLLAREHGYIGWGAAVVGGVLAGAVMMYILRFAPPPPSLDALQNQIPSEPLDAIGLFLHFILPGIATSLTFWLVVRLQYPRAFVSEGDSGS